MKKVLGVAAIAVLGLTGLNAQFEAGPYLGAAVGDGDHGLNIGATFAYYVPVAEKFKVGGITGIDQYFGNDDWPDATFLPIAASAKFNVTPRLFIGLDLGYAIGLTDGAGDGGFLAKPNFGFSLPVVDLYAYFKNISYSWDEPNPGSNPDWDDSWNLGSVGVGAAFKF